MHEPDLVILDEPFSGLDQLIPRIAQAGYPQKNVVQPIIFSDHVMTNVEEELCDDILMIRDGRVVLHDPRCS